MKLIDTHSHLYSSKFNRDQAEVIARAKEVLEAVYLPNIDLASIEAVLNLTAQSPDFFLPMMGLHPCSVQENYESVLAQMKQHLDDEAIKYVGIGETGLDLYWDKTTLELQQAALQVQIEWAKDYDLPIILHARAAVDETIEMIAKNHDQSLRGIFHCFDGTIEQAQQILEFGNFKLGIGGIVTYRKDVQAVVAQVPLSSIVLETDSPYLPPEPHRKDKPRRNESSYTKYVGQKVAELFDTSYEAVAEQTAHNVQEVFAPALKPSQG
ncbi:MAG: TatD family hydrolase [Bacteroidota bacterium]